LVALRIAAPPSRVFTAFTAEIDSLATASTT